MRDQTALAGQTALVTGAAKRLGRAIALTLADAGMDLVIHFGSSAEQAERTAEDVRRLGRRATTIVAALDDPSEAEVLFDRAGCEAGPIDLLVNNASVFPSDGLLDFTAESLQRNVQVNAMAPLLLARRFAAQGRDGCIVNLLDARMVDYDRQHVAYHLSKRMLHAITRMLAMELAPRVRVNAVAPGLVLEPEGKDADYLDRLAHTNPLNRHGSPQDVAEAVLFLARSGFVTGQTIYVDGGRNLRGNLYD